MGLLPRKYCDQTRIQSQSYQRQKLIFHKNKLPMNQILQDILLSLTKKQELTRSCKMTV
jgi:hypothetical protein